MTANLCVEGMEIIITTNWRVGYAASKASRERPKAQGPSSISIDGSFSDWRNVAPEFRDTIGDTIHRDHKGYGDLVYQNNTGRNDFVISKAAYNEQNLFFFAQTKDPITPHTDPHWMLLLIDADQNTKTGWLGYDYLINLETKNDNMTSIHEWIDKQWKRTGTATYHVNGNGLELSIPRTAIQEIKDPPSFDFHWADNIQSFEGVSEFGLNGDSAPNRRWNYRYEVEK